MSIASPGLPNPEDRAVARQHAVDLANLLGSKTVSYRRAVIGEPLCYYRVPVHTEDFWFKVLVSDTDFVFTGEHRKRGALTVPFCFSVKQGWRNLGTTMPLKTISQELGLAIFAQNSQAEPAVSACLLKPTVHKILYKLDLAPLRQIFINPIQIHAVSELITPQHCAEQVLLLRALLLSINGEMQDSTKKSPA